MKNPVNMTNMKSDPIQGILFNAKPVLLQERAHARMQKSIGRSIKNIRPSDTFFEKISVIKAETGRLTRRKTKNNS